MSLIGRIKDRALLELDLMLWRRSLRDMKHSGRPIAGNTVVFCQLMASIATVKVEALLASRLRRLGYRIAVIIPKTDPILERIFLATGPTDFFFAEGLTDGRDADQADIVAARLLEGCRTPEDIINLEVEGFRIGRNALSKTVREMRIGKMDPLNEEHSAALRKAIAASLLAKRRAEILIEQIEPSLGVFNERGYTPAGEMFDACLLAGTDVVQWVGAPQSDRLLFKRYTLATRDRHPFALGDDTWEELQRDGLGETRSAAIIEKLVSHYESGAWYNRQQLQEGKRIFDREATRSKLGVQGGRKVAVIFAHILYDATFFYGTSLYADYETWLVETVRGAIANPAMDWIIKVHPVNVWRSRMDGKPMEQLEAVALREAFGELPPHVRILPADTDVNTFSLFGAIDYGLTVRGTIGMELPCFGIPVVTAGSGRYAGNGFTLDPPTVDAYQELLRWLHTQSALGPREIELARLYAWGAFFRRPFLMESFRLNYNAKTFGLPHLSVDVEVGSGIGKDQSDLEFIANWMTDLRSSDLLGRDGTIEASKQEGYC
jgi:hypothetical protein